MAVPGTVGFIPVPLESKSSSFKNWPPAADEQRGPSLRRRPVRIAPLPHVHGIPSATILARVEAAVARARSRLTWDGQRELARVLGELGRDVAAAQGLGPQQLQVIMEGLRAHRRELPRSWVYRAVDMLARAIKPVATPEHARLLVQPMGWACRDGRPSPRAGAQTAYAGSELVRILCRQLGGVHMAEPVGRALLEAALSPLHAPTLHDDWLVHAYEVLADYVAGLEDAWEEGRGTYIDGEAQNWHMAWILDAVLGVKFSHEPRKQAEQAAQRAQLLKALCDPDGIVGDGLNTAVQWWLPPRLFPGILRQRARVAASLPAKAHWDQVLKALLRVHGPGVHPSGAASILRPLVKSLAGIDGDEGLALVWQAVGMREDGKQDLKFRTGRLDVTFSSERDGPLRTLLQATGGQGLRTLLLAIQGSLLDPRRAGDHAGLPEAALQDRRQRVIHRMLGLLAAYPADGGEEGPALIVREALRAHALLKGEPKELVAALGEWWRENPPPFWEAHEEAVHLMLALPSASAPAHEQLVTRLEQWRNWFNTHRPSHSDGFDRSAMHLLLVLVDRELSPAELRGVHDILFLSIVETTDVQAKCRAIGALVDFMEAVWDLRGLSLCPGSPGRAAQHHKEMRTWVEFVGGAKDHAAARLPLKSEERGCLVAKLDALISRAGKMLPDEDAARARSDSQDERMAETKGGDRKR